MTEREEIEHEIFEIKNNYPLGMEVMVAFAEAKGFTIEEALKSIKMRSQKPHACGCGHEHKERLLLVHPEMIRFLLGNQR